MPVFPHQEKEKEKKSSRHLCLGANIDDIHLLHNHRYPFNTLFYEMPIKEQNSVRDL